MEQLRNQAARFFHPDEKQNLVKYGFPSAKSIAMSFSRLWNESRCSWKELPGDNGAWDQGIIDPGSELMLKWNWAFLSACMLALFVDPLYFYLPSVYDGGNGTSCIKLDQKLGILVTFFRTVADVFYILHIVMKFRMGYVAPSSSVFGRGELVMNKKMIARRYLRTDFVVDLAAALPLPQIVIWIVIPTIKNSNADKNNNALALIVLLQYFPRLYLIFPLSSQIIKATGVVTKTAWAGAAINLILYMIASHVLGACWYLLSLERHITCWKSECVNEITVRSLIRCHPRFFDCDFSAMTDRRKWAADTNVFRRCNAGDSSIVFNYGIFANALTKQVVSANFTEKYLYCLWWGFSNLSSYAQNLTTSTFIGETTFAVLISIVGLVLCAHLIGNMQTYLQSMTARVEEWRSKQRDTEQWMKHRQLPNDLKERIRKFMQYKWLATQGVDEDSILQALPSDLRRDIQRHLCLDLVRRVPFFSQMDDQLLDAICERLVSSLSTEGAYLVREGDLVTEMFFIIRGKLESSTTNGGRSGFFNSITLSPGDFCGEELLAWALLPKSDGSLPASTRTVTALVEVEAFALRAEDLKFVANQFRKLHSKKLQHTFRYYSHHWRTWASCFIQDAWIRYKRRKLAKDLLVQESFLTQTADAKQGTEGGGSYSAISNIPSHAAQNIGVTILASRFAAHARRGAQRAKLMDFPKLQKPEEPDFSADPDDE